MSCRRRQEDLDDDDDRQGLKDLSRLDLDLPVCTGSDDDSLDYETKVDMEEQKELPKYDGEDHGGNHYAATTGIHRWTRANDYVLPESEEDEEESEQDSTEQPGATRVGGSGTAIDEEATVLYSMGSPNRMNDTAQDEVDNNIQSNNENLVEAELAPEPPEIVEGTPLEENHAGSAVSASWKKAFFTLALFVLVIITIAIPTVTSIVVGSQKDENTETPLTTTTDINPTSHPSATNYTSAFALSHAPSLLPSSSPTAVPSSSPTMSPTQLPTRTHSASPTDRPSSRPSPFPISPPSRQPTRSPTTRPTYRPSQQTSAPLTQNCENSIKLDIGSVFSATNAHGEMAYLPECHDSLIPDGPGVWFNVEGTGGRLKATTCTGTDDLDHDFDSLLSVWEGSCSDLYCVAGNDDGAGDDCGTESTVHWDSKEGRTYFIHVHGFFGSIGSFGIVVRRED